MRVLLIHQNFPGQFRHLAGALADRGHDVVALGRRAYETTPEGITYGAYAIEEPELASTYSDRSLELALRRASKVRAACLQLRDSGWIADAVLFHSSWGEGLYLRDIWPDQRLVAYPELYATPWVMGYGFDSTLGDVPEDLCITIRNSNLLALAAIADSDALVAPTRSQRDSFPEHLQQRFQIIHEGIDTDSLAPYPNRCLVVNPTLVLRPGDPVVSYCSRHLEPLRGFHIFMRSLPLLQRHHPTVQVLIAGANGTGYGASSTHPGGHLGALLEELEGQLDLERIHILGRISHQHLRGIFQASAAHVYLTYPYTLSWSLLEAMSCGAAVIGSRCALLEEVISHGENGLLVDFNCPEQLSEAMLQLLEDPSLRHSLGAAGRRTVERYYSLEACTSAYEALLLG
jgi:glycosyltransferase involved in cell wall biosynthesis